MASVRCICVSSINERAEIPDGEGGLMRIERRCRLTAATVWLVTVWLSASGPARAEPALPGEPCKVPPREVWTGPEIWAWTRICEGRVADFNDRSGVPLDPTQSQGWSKDRSLSADFLETVLLYDPYRSALTHRGVRIVGAWFPEPINLENAGIATELRLGASRFEQPVLLRSMRTDGLLSLVGSDFEDYLNMDKINVAEDLFMDGGAAFKNVDLTGARIGGQISLAGSRFTGKLNMESAEVGQFLLMYGGAAFEEVILRSAKIGGQVSIVGSTFAGILDLESAEVGGNLFLDTATGPEGWPETLELEGLTYAGLGGFGESGAADIAARDSQWFAAWLARDPTYAPQPYVQMARVLRDSGQAEKADDVLYAGRERERLELQRKLFAGEGSPEAWLDFLWKSALHAVIGYGYKVYRAFYWIAFFVILGTVLIWSSRQLTRHRIATGTSGTTALEYSIDMLLPIIELRKQHYDIDLTGPVRYYFYVHKVMGFVLVSFLIAGLSGLTK
jgi:hypothetical protein